MVVVPETLRAVFADGLPGVAGSMEMGKALAQKVCDWLEANRAGSEIVDLYAWAFNVEFVLKNGDYWAIECLSPDEFRMYPGFVRGDTVTWANIWVADNMSLDELVKNINDVAFGVTKEEFQNA